MEIVKGPDDDQLKALIETHQTALLRLCWLNLHDVQLAEDAVQETFIRAMRGYPGFRGDASSKTWLTRIAINVCRDMQRTFWFRRVDRRVTPEDLPLAAQSPEDMDCELTLAVASLPRKLREAITLYYYQDMTVNEIADLLDISQPSVSDRLRRARAKLKEYLKEAES